MGIGLSSRCNQRNNSAAFIRYAICTQQRLLQLHLRKLVATHSKSRAEAVSTIHTIFRDLTVRPRRSLIHLGGLAKSIFGIADDRDMSKMQLAVKQLHHEFEDQSLAVHRTITDTVSALNLFKRCFNSTLALIQDNHNSIEKLYRDILAIMQNNVAFTVHYLTAVSDMTQYFSSLDAELMQYTIGLSDLAGGRLTPALLPIDVVHELFHEISQHLTVTNPQYVLTFQSPTDVYQSTDFAVMRRNNHIYLCLHLPVSYRDHTFQVYKIQRHPLPLTAQHPHSTHLTGEHEYLAVNEQGGFYFFPTQQTFLTQCTQRPMVLCNFQPSLYSFTHPTCEFDIFKNNKLTVKGLCKFVVYDKPIKPSLTALTATSFLLSNVTEYTVTCNGVTNVRKQSCTTCVLELTDACSCVISFQNTTILPHYDACKTSTVTTQLKYPTNLMVLKSFVPHNNLQQFLADSLNETAIPIDLPPLKLFDSSYSKDIAGLQSQSLDLNKVLDNLQMDKVSYRHLSEKLYHETLSTQYSPSQDYIDWIVYVLCVVVALLVLAILFLISKYRTLLTALSLLNIPKATAFRFQVTSPTTLSSHSPNYDQAIQELVSDYYYHIILLTAASVVGLILVSFRKTFLLCIRMAFKQLDCLNLHVFPHKTPKFQVVLSMCCSHDIVYIHLQRIPIFTPSLPSLRQSKIARIHATCILPGLLYKANIVYSEQPALVYESGFWPLHHKSYIGYSTARKIRKIAKITPIMYQILLGRHGLFFCPKSVPDRLSSKQATAPRAPLTRSLTLPSLYPDPKKNKKLNVKISTKVPTQKVLKERTTVPKTQAYSRGTLHQSTEGLQSLGLSPHKLYPMQGIQHIA